MKKILFISLTIFICFAGFISCDDWTETEAKTFEQGNGKSPEYYEKLREWKASTDYNMSFGWYGFWTGTGADLKNCLIGLPDSMHVVSIWGPWLPSTLTEAKIKDKDYIQKVKGTKVMTCMFMEFVGQGLTEKTDEGRASWGWKPEWKHEGPGCTVCVSSDPATRAEQVAAINKYAKAVADSLIAGGYDGLDIDYEPQTHNAAELVSHPENTEVLVKAFSQYFGPKSSNPETLLCVDGHVAELTKETIPYLSYLIYQVYYISSSTSLDSFTKTIVERYTSESLTTEELLKKLFITVDFERYPTTGGGDFTLYKPDGIILKTNKLQAYAEWDPIYDGVTYKKAGFGSYHIEAEYYIDGKAGFYPWTRAAMRTVHPAKE